jgi:aspartyl-tRNA(Asn)/glutamyl-tRNA(Gln) amidotransferase subunit B
MDPEDISFSPAQLASVIKMVDEGKINRTVAKDVFEKVFCQNVNPEEYVEQQGLGLVSDDSLLKDTICRIIADNPQSVADYKKGKVKAMGFIVGQTMREMKGKADPEKVNSIVRELLDNI